MGEIVEGQHPSGDIVVVGYGADSRWPRRAWVWVLRRLDMGWVGLVLE